MRLYQRQTGFTLIELIMVIVIMGALSAVAINKFNRNAFDVAVAAGELVQAVRYAQDKSMSHSGAVNYQIAINSSGYAVTQGGSAITHPLTGALGYSRSWADISLDRNATIIFDSYGRPDLGTPLVVMLSKGSDSAEIIVEDVTGFAR